MAAIESEFSRAVEGKVRRKRNATGKLRAKAARVASGSSEVMVKVTSYGKGAGHVKAHLTYITRNGNVEMESDRGDIFKGKDEVKAFFKDWEEDFSNGKQYKARRDTMHLVLSMPESTPSEAVRSAVREFTKTTFGANHEYVFALHTDEPHPHCHVTVKMLGHNGKRLNPGRSDLADWREDFAQAMRDQGVDAEATRRSSRGVVKKAENTIVRHIEQGDRTHKPRPSRAMARQELDAIAEILAEQKGDSQATVRPWEAKIKAEQTAVRAAWMEAAKALDRPLQRPIYRQPKEQLNEQPDYANADTERIRQQRRRVALSQSDTAKTRSQEPPRPIASLRDLSGIVVVSDKRADKMLLQSNARHSLGRSREAGNEVRRSRISDIGTLSGSRPLTGINTAIEGDKALAARIRDFVAAMPSIESTVPTKHHELKQKLRDRFTRPRDQQQRKQTAIEQVPGQKDVVDKSALYVPKGKEQDR